MSVLSKTICTVEREVILGGELKPVTSTVHHPPNVQACIFWLRNRRRRTWRDLGRDLGRDPGRDPGRDYDYPSSQIDDLALLEAAGESVRGGGLPTGRNIGHFGVQRREKAETL